MILGNLLTLFGAGAARSNDVADPRTATPFGDHLQNVLGQPDNMDLIRLSEGAQNRKSGPGPAQAARAPKSYVFDRELIGFVEGAQNRKSGPGAAEAAIAPKLLVS